MGAVQTGHLKLFNHFENDGEMWAGEGSRQVSKQVSFSHAFQSPPAVMLSITLMDAASDQHLRYELFADEVTETGFNAVFRTWMDSRFARVRVQWMAIGNQNDPDMWTNI